jgi:hypothetical protein
MVHGNLSAKVRDPARFLLEIGNCNNDTTTLESRVVIFWICHGIVRAVFEGLHPATSRMNYSYWSTVDPMRTSFLVV